MPRAAKTKHAQHSDEDDYDGNDDEIFTLPVEDAERIAKKIENLPTLEKLLKEEDPNAVSMDELNSVANFVAELIALQPTNDDDVGRCLRQLQKRHRCVYKKSLLLAGYKHLLAQRRATTLNASPSSSPPITATTAHGGNHDLEDFATPSPTLQHPLHERCLVLERHLVSKAPRSQSGVLVVTVFTSPYPHGQRFTCKWNCYYCPNEPGQPRSYLLNEPGVRRANRLNFDAYEQFVERVASLVAIGHPADKVELLVLGGTWESYPESYRHEFIRDLYYAANTMYNVHDNNNSSSNTSVDGGAAKSQRALCTRAPLDLRQEQLLNETAACRIIGLTLETRPDTINHDLLVELRLLNCTRVQLGVQHTDDGILAGVHREATREDTMRAIKLLKDSCFKVDIHLMPDLPGSTPAADMNMFDDVLHSPDLQADQWKIYPCQTTPFTLIEQWYREGKYVPYGLENLVEVLLYAKTRVHPWIRLNRVIRDIPVDYVLAGVEVANLRQLLGVKLKEQGTSCRCIRCREVKGDRAVMAKLQSASICVREYAASGGTEIFISMETPDEATIFGFVRLRVDMRDVESPFDELRGCALIRELHVYGNLVTTLGEGFEDRAQHSGVGSSLLQRAEELAHARGYERVAVISGVGVRDYYRRKGYVLVHGEGICGDFLIKTLSSNPASSPSSSTVATATTAEAVATAPDAASGLLQRAWHHIRGLWGRSSKRAREE